MVSLNGPNPNPKRTSGGDAAPNLASGIRESFTDLVESVFNPYLQDQIAQRAERFHGAALDALRTELLPPDQLLLCLKLKNPHTGTYVFAEHGVLPTLLVPVCHAVTERIAQGRPVATHTLSRLGAFVAAPELAGVSGSLEAYKAMVVGATNFYQVDKSPDSEGASRVTPTGLFAQLMMNLHRCADHNPLLVAQVVRGLANVPVDAPLLDGLDSLLINTVHPSRDSIPPMVRVAAIHALAARVRKPPLRFACEEAMGTIDRYSAFSLLVDVARERREPSVVSAALSRLGEMLRDEARVMLTTKEGIARSSFVQSGSKSSPIATIASLGLHVDEIFLGRADELTQRVEFLNAFREAERVDIGLRIHRVSHVLSSIAPTSWRNAVLGAVHLAYRLVDRGLRGPVHAPTVRELSEDKV
jgi:hypothetical protein